MPATARTARARRRATTTSSSLAALLLDLLDVDRRRRDLVAIGRYAGGRRARPHRGDAHPRVRQLQLGALVAERAEDLREQIVHRHQAEHLAVLADDDRHV